MNSVSQIQSSSLNLYQICYQCAIQSPNQFQAVKTHTSSVLLFIICLFSLSMGAPVMVELDGETDPLKIATKELK